ncbi:MAG: tRNA (5-methylaminomethyl-2-thiouridine)(34)-methyltransferase MnmD [Bacteroidetes bacterium]|nr:tRNA (5-methylaminomethyl-2-thiouridine)(34)-methyltransferase MnmD [Bacteroidota bacterium]
MNIQITTTEDGSHTLYNKTLGEHYHSTFGAIQESQHIFIEAGLNALEKKSGSINILEIGFGTGLNALLTYQELMKKTYKINYVAIEPFMLDKSIYIQLNYADLLKSKTLQDIFIKIHETPCNVPHFISDSFILNKIEGKLQELELSENAFDLVYFDAFSPEIQPELWDADIFKAIYASMKNNSILTTYSAKGIVKRALKSAGFEIENLPGPIGKRQITRARKAILMSDCHHHLTK